MIISVEHTGSRTLVKHLGELGLWHFGQDDEQINDYQGHVDFPIRDPLAVSLSWRRFHDNLVPDRKRDPWRQELYFWTQAMEYLPTRPHTIHKIEDLPHLEGHSGEHWTRDYEARQELPDLPEVEALLRWYPHNRAFFEPHYPQGFWWYDG